MKNIILIVAILALTAGAIFGQSATPAPVPSRRYPLQQDAASFSAQQLNANVFDAITGAAKLRTYSSPSTSGVATVTVTNAAYVALPSTVANVAILVNNTGKSVGVKVNGSTTAITVLTATSFTFKGFSNLTSLTVTNITDSTSITPTFYYEAP